MSHKIAENILLGNTCKKCIHFLSKRKFINNTDNKDKDYCWKTSSWIPKENTCEEWENGQE